MNRVIDTKICIVCGKEFLKPSNRRGQNWVKTKFCSHSCYHHSRIGGTSWNKNGTSWNKDIPRSEETKRKLRKANKGERRSIVTEFKKGERISINTEFKKGHIPWHKGKTNIYSEETKEKMGRSWRGKHLPEERRRCQSKKMRGENGPGWIDGRTSTNITIRSSIESHLWREAVFSRDGWTCLKCKTIGNKLCSHHILNFAQYPELRFAIDNGITLCDKCHKEFHIQYGKKNNNQEQINQFLKEYYLQPQPSEHIA